MLTPKHLNKLKKLATKIQEKRVLKEQQLAVRAKQPPQAGDIFIFDTPETMGLQWVVLMPHPDNEQLLYTIPADDNSMVGSKDIALSENAICYPLTLRCGNGIWIHKTDFKLNDRVGIIEDWYLKSAIDTVKQIWNGSLKTSVWQSENDADINYQEWMDEVVTRGQFALENALQELPADATDVIQLTDFEWVKTLPSGAGVILTWTFDPLRQLCLQLVQEDNTARLIQSYNNGQNWQGDVLWPITFKNHHLEFVEDNGAAVCSLTPELVREIATEFNLPEIYQNWGKSEVSKQTSVVDKVISFLKQHIDLQPVSQFALALGDAPKEQTNYYQVDKIQLGIFADDEYEDEIQLKLKWLGDEQVNFILLEDDDPIQKEMRTQKAEFFFEPSPAHLLVVQDATTGAELYQLPLDKVE